MSVVLSLNFDTVTCCICGIVFGIGTHHNAELKRKAVTGEFFCPNGHGQHYLGKSKDQQIADLQWAVQAKDNALAAERQKRERLEKRITRGVCLYCNRSFANLREHMRCKHKGKP